MTTLLYAPCPKCFLPMIVGERDCGCRERARRCDCGAGALARSEHAFSCAARAPGVPTGAGEWSCQDCGQRNSAWTRRCGRCERPRVERVRPAARRPGVHEVETFSGRYVDVVAPVEGTIAIEDVAHALSMTCRFGGHVRRFYSVAEHAVLVADKLAAEGCRDLALAGLHHDDAEAYLGDVPRPLKLALAGTADPTFVSYADLERRMERVVCLDLSRGRWRREDLHHEAVGAADAWALMVEARELLPSGGEGWGVDGWALDCPWPVERPDALAWPPPPWRAGGRVGWVGGLSPSVAERLWLRRHAQLAEAPA